MNEELEVGTWVRSNHNGSVGPITVVTPDGYCVAFGDGDAWVAKAAVRPYRAPVTKASLLDAAKDAVADRGLNYGKPENNFNRIADLWNAHLRNKRRQEGDLIYIDAADVAMMMILMKIARLQNDPTHMDSVVDAAGYAACLGEIVGGQQKDA